MVSIFFIVTTLDIFRPIGTHQYSQKLPKISLKLNDFNVTIRKLSTQADSFKFGEPFGV